MLSTYCPLDRPAPFLLFASLQLTIQKAVMHRRKFLESSALVALTAVLPPVTSLAHASDALEPFQWKTDNLTFSFAVIAGKLREKQLVPADIVAVSESSGVEVALQCSGENSPDQGLKSATGQPGARLVFAGRREEATARGKSLVCTHTDSTLGLRVESIYESFAGLPVIRRHSAGHRRKQEASAVGRQSGICQWQWPRTSDWV